jgi:FixJ family two-component response regulator
MSAMESIVFLIDDDPSFRRSTQMLMETAGFEVSSFASAEEFLRSRQPNVPACLVLDVRLPRLSGLDLQRELFKAGIQIPIIFITGHGDIPMTVQAMKAGAVEFLTKPFREQELLDTPYVAQLIPIGQRAWSAQSWKTCAGIMNRSHHASAK